MILPLPETETDRNNHPQVIIVVFALLMAALWTGYSYYFPYKMGHDQTLVGTMIAKDLDPTLFSRDYAFQDDSLYRNYIPVIRWLFRSLTQLTGSFEKCLLALVAPVVLVYALGMALLLFRLTGSLWAALLFTFLSIPYRPAPPGEIWGVGGGEFILARTLATAMVPYLFLIFFKVLEAPNFRASLLLGALTGLSAFLHPPTALFTGEIFVALYLLTYLKEPRRWIYLGSLVLAYALAGLYPLTVMDRQPVAVAATVNFGELSQVIMTYLKIPANWGSFPGETTERRVWLLLGAGLLLVANYLLRPRSQRPRAALQAWLWGGLTVLYLCWRISGKGADLTWLYALAAIYLVLRYHRGDPQRLDWWLLGLCGLSLVFSLLPYYFLTLLWRKLELLPLTSLVIEHYRAGRLTHFFLFLLSARVAVYLVKELAAWLRTSEIALTTEYAIVALSIWNRGVFWVALGGVTLYELLRRYRSRRLALAGLLAFCLTGAGALCFASPSLKQLCHDMRTRGRDLRLPADFREDAALYAWARGSTPKDALFYYGSAALRFQGRRSITHNRGDLINHRDPRYVGFYRRYQELEQAYTDPAVLAREAQRLGVDYIVVDKKRRICLYFPLAYENQKYLVYQTSHGKITSAP